MAPTKVNATGANPDLATIVGDALGNPAFPGSDDERPDPPPPAIRWIPTVNECRQKPRLDSEQRDGACALSISGEPFYCGYEPDHG